MGDALQGTLDLLILKTLEREPMHGWGIAQRIGQLSAQALTVGQGSLYPALRRLEEKGWVEADWQVTENGRRARYYGLTRAGRRALTREVARWRDFEAAVEQILATA